MIDFLNINYLIFGLLLASAAGLTGYFYARLRLKRREEELSLWEADLRRRRVDLQRQSYQESTSRIHQVSGLSDTKPREALEALLEQSRRDYSILEQESQFEQRLYREENQSLREELAELKGPPTEFRGVLGADLFEDAKEIEELEIETQEELQVDDSELPLDSEASSEEPAMEDSFESAPENENVSEESTSQMDAPEEPQEIEPVLAVAPEEPFEVVPDPADAPEKPLEVESSPEDIPDQMETTEASNIDQSVLEEESTNMEEEESFESILEGLSSDSHAFDLNQPNFEDFEFHWTEDSEESEQPEDSAPVQDSFPVFRSVSDFVPKSDSRDSDPPQIDLSRSGTRSQNRENKGSRQNLGYSEQSPIITSLVGLSPDQFALLSDLGYASPEKRAQLSADEINRLSEIFRIPPDFIRSHWMS